ncbi:MAG: glycerophosphodiester phosphodiesterase family protein [Pseudomonadota bacterium]
MNVLNSFAEAWQRRTINVPIVLAVRLLSFAVIAPLIAVAIQFGISLSGQSALTDQDIARFIFSPLGFPTFLVLAGLVMVGTIFGTATMTISMRDSHLGIRDTVASGFSKTAARAGALMIFAARLVIRILLVLLPIASLGALAAWWLLGDYDINYYLTAWPPQFVALIAIGGILAAAAAALLLPRLLSWAVALHFVLFTETSPKDAFSVSAETMQGKRLALLKDLILWFVIRTALLTGVAVVFIFLLAWLPGALGGGLRVRLGLTAGVAILWAAANIVAVAIALDVLAQILLHRFEELDAGKEATKQVDLPTIPFRTIAVGSIGIVAIGGVIIALFAPRFGPEKEVEIIAHRGASGMAPENTMAAIDAAVAAGADWVEIDVQETADGEIVVMHDSDFMKLSGNPLKIWDATTDGLNEIDIGSWFDPSFSDERVPTLLEALEAVRDRSKLLIELKYYGHDEALEQRTIDIVEAAGMTDQVATMSLKYPAVEKMQSLRPGWDAGVLAATAVGDLTALNADFVAVNGGLATARLIRNIQQENKKLYVWTINDPFEMSAMISLGVDGLITDEPALAQEVIDLRASLSGPQRMFLVFLERFCLTSVARPEIDARI